MCFVPYDHICFHWSEPVSDSIHSFSDSESKSLTASGTDEWIQLVQPACPRIFFRNSVDSVEFRCQIMSLVENLFDVIHKFCYNSLGCGVQKT